MWASGRRQAPRALAVRNNTMDKPIGEKATPGKMPTKKVNATLHFR
jgi:hypothetical protein